MSYLVRIKGSAAKELARLPRDVRERLIGAIDSLAAAPLAGSALGWQRAEGWPAGIGRLRVGSCRIVYEVREDDLVVLVVRVAHRREFGTQSDVLTGAGDAVGIVVMVRQSLRTVGLRERIAGPPSQLSPRVRGNLWYGRPHLGLPWSIPVAPVTGSWPRLLNYSTTAITGKPNWGRLLGGGLTEATVDHRLGKYPGRRPVLPGSESLRKRIDTVAKEITMSIIASIRAQCDYCNHDAIRICASCRYYLCGGCSHPGTPGTTTNWVCNRRCLYWRDPRA